MERGDRERIDARSDESPDSESEVSIPPPPMPAVDAPDVVVPRIEHQPHDLQFPADFPDVMTVGVPGHPTTYDIQPGQLLLEFREDVSRIDIDTFVAANGLVDLFPRSPARETPYNARSEKSRLRWVYAPDAGAAVLPHDLAQDYLKRFGRDGTDSKELWRALPVYYKRAAGSGSAAAPLPDRLIVRVDPARVDEAIAFLEHKSFRLTADPGLTAPYMIVELTDDVSERLNLDIVQELREQPGLFTELEFDWYRLEGFGRPAGVGWPRECPNQPGDAPTPRPFPRNRTWGKDDPRNTAAIRLNTAQSILRANAGKGSVSVAVIDSGFDLGHPVWNKGAGNLLDLNAQFDASAANRGGGGPYDASTADVENPHGTATAGMIAQMMNHANLRIIPIRIATPVLTSEVYLALCWAEAQRARVINMSLGTVSIGPLVTKMSELAASNPGVVICAASGNYNSESTPRAQRHVEFPADHLDVIAVGALDQTGVRKTLENAACLAWGSRWGSQLDVMAPGVFLWTADESGKEGYNADGTITAEGQRFEHGGDPGGDYLALAVGTSIAAPQVSALAALILSRYPHLTGSQVREAIVATCDRLKAPSGTSSSYGVKTSNYRNNKGQFVSRSDQTGYGRINVEAALKYAADLK